MEWNSQSRKITTHELIFNHSVYAILWNGTVHSTNNAKTD